MAEEYLFKGLQGLGQPQQQPETSPDMEQEVQRIYEGLKQAAAQDGKDPVEAQIDEEAWSSDDSLATAQRFFSGMALGWGDELGIAAGAAISALFIEDTPFSQIYKEEKEKYDRQQEEFKKRQGGAALTADIAGAVASPLTWMSAPASLAAKAPAAAQFAGNVARAGAEGAIYGAGMAEEGQRLEGAQEGALLGAGGYTAIRAGIKGLGLAGKAAFSRKIEGDLVDEAGEFIPITLAAKRDGAEGFIRTFYRDVVAPSFGGKGIIRSQEDRIILKGEDVLENQKQFTRDLIEGSKEKVAEIKTQFNEGVKVLGQQKKEAEKLLSKDTATSVAPLEVKLKTLESGKAEEIFGKAAKQTQQIVDGQRFNFRNSAFVSSLPAGATSNDLARIMKLEDIGQRAQALDELWNSVGYSMIKGKKIRIPANEFETSLMKMIDEDAVLKVNIADVPAFKNNLKSIMQGFDTYLDKNRRIDGDVLSAMRSKIGTVAANAGDPQMRRAYYAVQSKIDSLIKKQLTPSQLKAFEKESGRWKSNVILRDSIESTRVKKRGIFDEEDWLKSVAANNQYDKRYGTGTLSKEALSLQDTIKSTQKAIARRASQAAKIKANEIEKVLKQHASNLERQLQNLEKQLEIDTKRLRIDSQAAQRIAKNKEAIKAANAEKNTIKRDLDVLKKARSSENPSWYHTLAAHSILSVGLGLGSLGGGAAAALGGLGVAGAARVLSSPTAQRVVAGQTPTQQAAYRAITSEGAGQAAEAISRAGARGMLTGQ
jgi:hypothetical protein